MSSGLQPQSGGGVCPHSDLSSCTQGRENFGGCSVILKNHTVICVESGTITTLGGAGPVHGVGGWPGWLAQAHCYWGQLWGARGRPAPPSSAAQASARCAGWWWPQGPRWQANEYLVTAGGQAGPGAVPVLAHLGHGLGRALPTPHLAQVARHASHCVLPGMRVHLEQ